ncbi:hypothetical protein JKA74_06990 [Marivirga sp. S37H4]|uniref:Uncharacterized protein n=1 Tax=Marivirga aurantiaca TaxID=2802615 RepID=A0A935C738_9BACT|nr:hypothetical protein [Marivirga aurantiaca]MBK6264776.1 hypothetical protein [Marivirga aurantiaca]
MKKLSVYLMVLFAAFLLQSCGDDENTVEERENVSYYGETELAFTSAAVGDSGEDGGYHFTNIYLAEKSMATTGFDIAPGESLMSIFFSSKSEHPEAKNYTEIKDAYSDTDENIFEGAKLIFDYDPNGEPGSASENINTGSINLIEYDFNTKTIEFEYEFLMQNGKTSKGYYKGSFDFLGEIG